MPRRYASKPGTVSKLCACGNRMMVTQVACVTCWRQLPPPLQHAYRIARDGDCSSGPALAKAIADIQDHVRKAAAI